MQYEFTQRWTKEDYIAFTMNHMVTSIFKVSNLILFGGSIGYLLVTPFFTGEYTFFYLGIGIFLFLVLFLMFTKKNAGKAYEKNKEKMFVNYRLDENGLTYLNVEGELTKHWNEFYSIKETEDYFFIYFNKHNGMLLAKRDFSSEVTRFVVAKCNEHMVDKRKIKFLEVQ